MVRIADEQIRRILEGFVNAEGDNNSSVDSFLEDPTVFEDSIDNEVPAPNFYDLMRGGQN